MAVEGLIAGMPVVATKVRGRSEIFPSSYPLLSASGDIPALASKLASALWKTMTTTPLLWLRFIQKLCGDLTLKAWRSGISSVTGLSCNPSGGRLKMRVLVVHNFYQQAGGEDTVFRAETALLRHHGHDVETFTGVQCRH